jgi:hypothetical protein
MKIAGITKRQTPNHQRSVLVVERSGARRQLSVIEVAQLDMVFSPTLGFEHAADGKLRNLQELPLIRRLHGGERPWLAESISTNPE